MNELLKEWAGKKVIRVSGVENGSDKASFYFEDGTIYDLFHTQDCCECVWLEDVCGNPSDLVGETIISATEEIGDYDDGIERESCTWTFYNIRTLKTTIVLRSRNPRYWCGDSNGYYSESVDIFKRK